LARRAGDKYDTIIQAAIRVFAENGYHNAQVSKIAREANVADGTIYLYFDNKADLLISVFRETMGNFVQKVKETISQYPNASDQLKALIHAQFESLARDINLALVTQVELRQANADIRMGIGPILKEYLDVIDGIVELGKRQGIFREDVITHVARKMIFGTLDETVTSWVMSSKKHDLLNLVEPVHQCLVHGLKK
jgi:TetR/AcrR family fatty acid metabolism transcriptional regulator